MSRIRLSLTVAALTALWSATHANPLDDYNVEWTTPSQNHTGSMPIGNGETGLNVWVEPNGDLVFLIARTDSWDENERLCKLGRVRVQFTPSLAGTAFRQTLRLRHGMIEIVGGDQANPVTARVWVDAHQQVVHVTADSKQPFEARAALETWRNQERQIDGTYAHGVNWKQGPKTSHPDTVLSGKTNRVVWYHRNPTSPWEHTLRLQGLAPAIQAGKDPLLHRTFGGLMRGEGLVGVDDRTLKTAGPVRKMRLKIDTYTQVPATEMEWLAGIEKQAAATDAIQATQATASHAKWWSEFWNRSWIYVTGDDSAFAVTQGYLLQRFVSASGGRGKFPIKFNGTIFTVDEGDLSADYRAWGGCYWFQNTRLMYWPMLASGDFEMMRPLFRMYGDALPLAAMRTKTYFNHDGAFFPETISSWGTYDNGGHGWGYRDDDNPGAPVVNEYVRFHYSGILELLAMMIDYYRFTGDADYLQKELLLHADAYLTWWDQHWKRREDGKLHMYPSYACETYWNCQNPTQDLAGLKWCLDGLLALSDEEIGTDRRSKWARFRTEIPPIPLRDGQGGPVISPAEAHISEPRNAENPELYAVFPFRLYGVGKPGLEIAQRTFNQRRVKAGHGWHQDDSQAAFLGLADEAAGLVSNRAKTKHGGSRFPAFWGPNYDWIPDQFHCGHLVLGLQTLLLQADNG
jgi:alpha-L-fucosidase 2